jgi:murein DD-endopeptidase MepM/ murein hydrolase activator NlpD
VRAAHEGIVDRVNRGPNEEHGGIYVRVAHRDGTVFTWYFHLAAVPRWITPGTKVEAGQIIGLLGDTGVKKSAPHLHFAMTVKPSKDAPERYLDPESLLSLWPLWIPDEDGTGQGRVSVHGAPGVPMRGKPKAKRHRGGSDEPAAAPDDAPVAPPPPEPAGNSSAAAATAPATQ